MAEFDPHDLAHNIIDSIHDSVEEEHPRAFAAMRSFFGEEVFTDAQVTGLVSMMEMVIKAGATLGAVTALQTVSRILDDETVRERTFRALIEVAVVSQERMMTNRLPDAFKEFLNKVFEQEKPLADRTTGTVFVKPQPNPEQN